MCAHEDVLFEHKAARHILNNHLHQDLEIPKIDGEYIYGKDEESSTSSNEESTGDDMTKLLARLINGEARGEPYEGQVAVGAVILNRVKKSKNFQVLYHL